MQIIKSLTIFFLGSLVLLSCTKKEVTKNGINTNSYAFGTWVETSADKYDATALRVNKSDSLEVENGEFYTFAPKNKEGKIGELKGNFDINAVFNFNPENGSELSFQLVFDQISEDISSISYPISVIISSAGFQSPSVGTAILDKGGSFSEMVGQSNTRPNIDSLYQWNGLKSYLVQPTFVVPTYQFKAERRENLLNLKIIDYEKGRILSEKTLRVNNRGRFHFELLSTHKSIPSAARGLFGFYSKDWLQWNDSETHFKAQ